MSSVDRDFLARDTYGVWKRRVRKAEDSIRVFTPYFDKLLERLLSNASIAPDRVSVVTDLSPGSGTLSYRRQLIGARALLEHGVEIRSLPRLHAKVLLCDGRVATVGSQNFTTYARGSKETTIADRTDVSESVFVETLEAWFASATPVSPEFIETLLNHLESPMEELEQAHHSLAQAFQEEWSVYLDDRAAELRAVEAAEALRALPAKLAAAVRNATERQARETVWAQLKDSGGWNGFRTFSAWRDGTFTEWVGRSSSGRRSRIELERLRLHPVIISSSGRMGFARVATQQISYVRFSIDWDRPIEINGRRYDMFVRLPETEPSRSNMEITLSLEGRPQYAKLVLHVLFNGTDAKLIAWLIESASAQGLLVANQRGVLESLASDLDDPELMGDVVAFTFRPFKYKYLGIEDHNAATFFPSGWVSTTVIDFRDTHVLVATPQ